MPVATSYGATLMFPVLPVLSDAKLSVLSIAMNGAARTASLATPLAVPSSTLSQTMYDAATIVSPGSGATIKAGDSLNWSALANTVSLVVIEDITHNSTYLTALTSGATLAIPDLSSSGHPYPVGANLVVQVMTLPSFTRVDDACASTGLLDIPFMLDQLLTAYPLPFESHRFSTKLVERRCL